MQPTQFEISNNKHVYFGTYFYDGELTLDNVHTFNEDEQRIDLDSLNDAEIYHRIETLVASKFSDEIEAEKEELNQTK